MDKELTFTPGDKIQVEWSDGLSDIGTFLRTERGFIVFTDASGRQGACAKGHAKVTRLSGSS
jgi:hypothetical protein